MKKRSPNPATDRILSPHQVEEMLADNYGDTEEAVIFIYEQSKPITPVDLMFLPFLNADFGKDPKLGMVFGTGSGCALIRKTAIEKVQAIYHSSTKSITSCQDFIDALQQLGFTVRQDLKLSLDLLV